jgi:phospholipid/cholesterol/gamma-HCH transport system permease protein
LFDFLKAPVQAFQEFVYLAGRAFRNIFRSPHYTDDIFVQMDIIGIGSLPVVIMTGFFTGAVMGLADVPRTRHIRRHGPNRTDRLDYVGPRTRTRADGSHDRGTQRIGYRERTRKHEGYRTDRRDARIRYRSCSKTRHAALVIATAVTLPLLTIIADFMGIFGGYIIASTLLQITASQYWSMAWRSLAFNDVAQGLLKPFAFAIVISLVGCYYGIRPPAVRRELDAPPRRRSWFPPSGLS